MNFAVKGLFLAGQGRNNLRAGFVGAGFERGKPAWGHDDVIIHEDDIRRRGVGQADIAGLIEFNVAREGYRTQVTHSGVVALDLIGKDAIVIKDGKQDQICVYLKYTPDNRPVITGLQRESKPGQRRYVKSKNLPQVRNGLGIAILSTSKGVMTDTQARLLHLGGEHLCSVW